MLFRFRVLAVSVAVLGLVVALATPGLARPPEDGPPGLAKQPKGERPPEVAVTLSGTVSTATDADGDEIFTLTVDGVTYELDAGPRWFHVDGNPLAAFVGQDVTVEGEQAEGSTEVDVHAVNGTQIRASGKPPWAGGWKVVGERHPGWSQAKADRFAAKFGDCFPPGRCKDKPQGTTESESGDQP